MFRVTESIRRYRSFDTLSELFLSFLGEPKGNKFQVGETGSGVMTETRGTSGRRELISRSTLSFASLLIFILLVTLGALTAKNPWLLGGTVCVFGLWLWNVSIGGHLLPRTIVVVVLVATAFLLLRSTGTVALNRELILIATSPDDRSGAFAHQLQRHLSRVQSELLGRQEQLGVYYQVGTYVARDVQSARRVLKAFPSYRGVIAGDDRTRFLVWRDEQVTRVGSMLGGKGLPPDLRQLKIVTKGPSAVVTHDLLGVGGDFLARILLGGVVEPSQKSIWYRDAALLPAHWPNPYHRAYASWEEGTTQLTSFLEEGGAAPALLETSERLFSSASRNITRSKNTGLFVAILNNRAIVRLLRAWREGDPELRSRGLSDLATALKIAHDGDVLGGASNFIRSAASENGRALGVSRPLKIQSLRGSRYQRYPRQNDVEDRLVR